MTKIEKSNNTIIERILSQMEEKGFSSDYQLAKAAGFKSNDPVRNIIKRRSNNPTVATLLPIASALGVSVSYLIGETDNPQASNKPDVDSIMSNPHLGTATSMIIQATERNPDKKYSAEELQQIIAFMCYMIEESNVTEISNEMVDAIFLGDIWREQS